MFTRKLNIVLMLCAWTAMHGLQAQTGGVITEYTVVGKDTIPSIGYDTHVIKGKRELSAKKQTQYFELKERVKKAYPHAKRAGEEYKKALEEIKGMSEVAAKARMKKLEKDLWDEYTPIIKNMSAKTARILVKLIDRETGKNSYEMVKDLRGGGKAVFYQMGSVIFGVNLKTEYDPEKNDQDRIIEELIGRLEKGEL